MQYRLADLVCSGSQAGPAWTACGKKWYSHRCTHANLATAASLACQSSIASPSHIVLGQVILREAIVGGDRDIGDFIKYSGGDWIKYMQK